MPPANTPALLASKGTNVKVIPSNHNVPKEDYESSYRWDPNPVDRKLRLQALEYAAAIHVLFEEFGNWFPEKLREKVVAIPNYVSPEFDEHQPLPVREKLILAVGRLSPVKNYLQLARSWAAIHREFPEWRVLLYGVGPQAAELRKTIRELGIGGSFLLGGHRSNLGEEYGRASLFCHPALFEGFGLSPAEALRMGVPVLLYSDCSGSNQFVKNGVNGLTVDRHDESDTLASGLKTLLEDEELRQRLGRNAPASVEHFSLERYTNNWVQLIERLTA